MFIRIFKLALRDLSERSLRCVLTVIGIAIAIATFVAIESVVQAFERSLVGNIAATGTHLEVMEKGAVNFLTSLIPESIADRIDGVKGVKAVAPMLVRLTPVATGRSLPLLGWPAHAYLWGTIKIVAGRVPAHGQPLEIVLGAGAAESLGARLGDIVPIQGIDLAVVGIAETEDRINRSAIFLQLPDLQAISYRAGQATAIGVRLEPEALANLEQVKAELSERLPGFNVVSTESMLNDIFAVVLSRSLSKIMSVIAISLVFFGVLNTVWTSAKERQHEFAILRAVGWPVRRIALFIVCQAAVISIAGVAVGLALGYAGARIVTRVAAVSAYLDPQFEPQVLLRAVCVCLAISVVGALLPVWAIARINLASVLRSP